MKGAPVSGDASGHIRVGKTDSVRKMGEETEGKTETDRERKESMLSKGCREIGENRAGGRYSEPRKKIEMEEGRQWRRGRTGKGQEGRGWGEADREGHRSPREEELWGRHQRCDALVVLCRAASAYGQMKAENRGGNGLPRKPETEE